MPGAEWEAPLAALGRDVERTHQRVDRLEKVLRVLSQTVAELHTAITAAEPDLPAVRSWLLAADPGQAREDLADLTGWLAEVYLRYPDAALPSCWLWHPAVVEELWWLRRAHHEAYDGPHASYPKAGDWHDRQRPAVARRVQHWLRDCDLARHEPDLPARSVPLNGSADRIADTWTRLRATPPPTPDEITEADQYEHHQHRTNHR